MNRQFPQWWLRRGLRASLLTPLALIHGGLASVRQALYAVGILRTYRVRVPVIVVGGVFVGGTGKTPTLEALVLELRARGLKPGIISRGYGADGETCPVFPTSSAAQVGDEPVLLARRTGAPVWIGRRRAQAARALVQAHPEVDVILSDDGLQHLALHRDAELAVVDSRGFGNGLLIPAGPLRESPGRLNRVTAVVLRGRPPLLGVTRPQFALTLGIQAFRHLSTGESMDPAAFRARFPAITAAAGIGFPAQFRASLAELGLQASGLPQELPDHFDWGHMDWAGGMTGPIVITEKDAVKAERFDDPRLWVATAVPRLESGLTELLLERIRGSQAA
jgi:tetraacyldisaccharide 4'-kinase